MYYSLPFFTPDNDFRGTKFIKPYKPLDEALLLIKDAIMDERKDELFYDYLISASPSEEEKTIITSIRDDERKHNKFFREIYTFYTRQSIPAAFNINGEVPRPNSYAEGIKNAKFGELAAVEKYRDIRAGIPDEYYRDMVFEIITDELKHAHKYDYILYTILDSKLSGSDIESRSPLPKTGFTTEEAIKVARVLGINFPNEKFDVEQFRMGMDVELEHGRRDPATDVTGDDPIITGKIALAHLREFPDYYTRLDKLEQEAKNYWSVSKSSAEN